MSRGRGGNFEKYSIFLGLVTGYWLLVTGCWLLVAGYWLLVAGCWLLVAGYWPVLRSFSLSVKFS